MAHPRTACNLSSKIRPREDGGDEGATGRPLLTQNVVHVQSELRALSLAEKAPELKAG